MKLSYGLLLLGCAISGLADACTEPRHERMARPAAKPADSVAAVGAVDTTVIVRDSGPVIAKPVGQLTIAAAQQLVEAFYQTKGFYIQGTAPLAADTDGVSLCIGFDTCRTLGDLNQDSRMDVLVSYWLMPCGSSGTCFWPTKALLVSQPKGYRLVGEGFVSDYTSIDSVALDQKQQLVLRVSYWDCSEHRVRRRQNVKVLLR